MTTSPQPRARRRRDGRDNGPGGGTLFTEPVLVVGRRAEPEYGVFDSEGTRVGGVLRSGRAGQRPLRKVVRLLAGQEPEFEVRDANHSRVLKVTRPARAISSFVVTRADETPIGEIVLENGIGRARFGFVAGGRRIGGMEAVEAHDGVFSISGADGVEVASVHRDPTAPDYVVHIHRQLADPLASIVVAAALTLDTALLSG